METSAHFEIAEIDLVYNAPKDLAQRPRVAKASEASVIFKTTWDKGKIGFVEQFKILLLNRMYKVLGICTIATGGMTATIVDIRLVMAAALKSGAVQMIVAHNHPSGNLNPSEADKRVTRQLVDAGKLLNIRVLDHVILSVEGFYSFADEGLM
ncbi:MAG TPA: JAB domain-containing protein [Anseongella sp.]